MYHFAQIKALSSGVNLNGWTFYFELIGCCRNPLNVSNSIRYSITIVQFNLSNLIGFDCSFLGHSPLSIQELWRYPQAKKKQNTPTATTLSCWQRWNSSLDGTAGSDRKQLDCHVKYTRCSCGVSAHTPLYFFCFIYSYIKLRCCPPVNQLSFNHPHNRICTVTLRGVYLPSEFWPSSLTLNSRGLEVLTHHVRPLLPSCYDGRDVRGRQAWKMRAE